MKYKLTDNTKIHNGTTLYQIEALKDFGNVNKGDLGGYIQAERNLNQSGDCWIYDSALARDNARVVDNAKLRDNAIARDHTVIYGTATLNDNAVICDVVSVSGDSTISNYAHISGQTLISGNTKINKGERT